MNRKEELKYLMEMFLKSGQVMPTTGKPVSQVARNIIDQSAPQTISPQTTAPQTVSQTEPDAKKNFLILDNLIAKLKKDLSTTSDAAFTAAKDTELFVQDLTNSSSFIKYLYNNKVALDGKQLVLDHNATGAEKFIDLEYSQLSADLKKLYFPFPEGNQDYWVYKDGIEKFLHSKMEEAEKSTDPGFKNILKTLLKKLSDEINTLAPSLQIIPESKTPTGDTIDMIPATLALGNPSAPGQYPLTLKDLISYTSMLNFFNKFKIPYEASKKGYLDAANVLLERAKFKKDRAHLDKLESRRL